MQVDGPLCFRKATSADMKATRALVMSAFRGPSSRAGWTTEADLLTDERISEEGLLAKINQSHGGVLLIQDSAGSLVACAEIVKKGNTAHFGMGAVDPLRQTGGIGATLIAFLEQMARDGLAVDTAELYVIWTRKELIDWYIRKGFVKTNRTAAFPYNELVNGKALRDDLYFVVLSKGLGQRVEAKL